MQFCSRGVLTKTCFARAWSPTFFRSPFRHRVAPSRRGRSAVCVVWWEVRQASKLEIRYWHPPTLSPHPHAPPPPPRAPPPPPHPPTPEPHKRPPLPSEAPALKLLPPPLPLLLSADSPDVVRVRVTSIPLHTTSTFDTPPKHDIHLRHPPKDTPREKQGF